MTNEERLCNKRKIYVNEYGKCKDFHLSTNSPTTPYRNGCWNCMFY
uniref:Uncharacterized protein n=1 Tax=viral metagenome TaxID=1070528 RepID=A0A6M3X7Y0_9ZZZZ